jgi:ribosome recycling factor
MAVSSWPAIRRSKTFGDLKHRMDQAVATFQANLASTRTGRASVHMLDQVKVDYYGTPTPISQLAQVSTPEAQLILISPWDPTVLKEIEKALRTSDLGFNPQTDGKVIRVPVPPMTEERRRDVVKHLNKVSKSTAPPSATCAATATTCSRSWPRKRRSAKTKRSAP